MNELFTIDKAASIGAVTLGVADLPMMTRYYQEIIGLKQLESGTSGAALGIDGQPFLRLEQRDGHQHKAHSGLFHLAILLPTRPHLGQWLKHYLSSMNQMIGGAGDHLVSEALYLNDPEGNGVEIYWDRPRQMWKYENGKVKMATLAVDLADLAAQASADPFQGLPSGTTLGHIHLQVDQVAPAEAFYRDQVGLGHSTNYPGATFLGAGGYHHHIGANTWNSRGRGQPPAGSLGLINFSLRLPTKAARLQLLDHLAANNIAIDSSGETPEIKDPAGNIIRLTVAQS